MKFLLLTIGFALAIPAWADKNLFCELEAQPIVRGVLIATKIGLENRELKSADVERMISDPERIRDPYEDMQRGLGNLDFRRSLRRQLGKLKPEHVAEARKLLGMLIGHNAQQENFVSEARHLTRMVLAPMELPLGNGFTPMESKHAPVWHKLPDGRLLLLSLNPRNARLQFFEPGRRDPVMTREILPSAQIDANVESGCEIQSGHVFVMKKVDGPKTVTLHNIEKNVTGVTTDLPSELENIFVVRAADGDHYVIARTPKSVITYKVGPDLKLTEFRRHSFKSDFLRVVNSSEGRVLVVAANQKRATLSIFDPLAEEPPRLVRLDREFDYVSAVVTPGGNYAIAVKSPIESEGMRNRYSFITKLSDKPLQTDLLPEDASGGPWYVTREGKPIFPVKTAQQDIWGDGMTKREFKIYRVHLFEPFTPTIKPPEGRIARLLRFPGTLLASAILAPDYLGGRVGFHETDENRLLVVLGEIRNMMYEVALYDPALQNTPVQTVTLEPSEQNFSVGAPLNSIVEVEMLNIREFKDPVFLVTRLESSEIYSGWDKATKILSAPKIWFSSVKENRDGHIYVTGRADHPGPPPAPVLKLFRITDINPENP